MSEQVKQYMMPVSIIEDAEKGLTRVWHIDKFRAVVTFDDYAALRSAYNDLESHLIRVQETGAEAYWNAIEDMETFQLKRANAGKSAGCQGSLTDGMSWVYSELERVESECERLRAELDCPFRLARHSKRLVDELRSELAKWQKCHETVHAPALNDAYALIEELRAELAAIKEKGAQN